MGDEVTAVGILLGAVTAGVGIVAKEVGGYFVKRKLEQRDVAYRVTVDLLTTIPAVEQVFHKTSSRRAPQKHDDLIGYPSHWPMRPSSLDLAAMVAAFSDAELHRDLMLVVDGHAAYAECSEEHKKAFAWLLENEKADWLNGVIPRERLETLNHQRARLAAHTRAILRNSYSCLRRLLEITKSTRWPTDRNAELLRLMHNRYGLSAEALRLAEAYYTCKQVISRFDAGATYETWSWSGRRGLTLPKCPFRAAPLLPCPPGRALWVPTSESGW
jgi:hypothetical protein